MLGNKLSVIYFMCIAKLCTSATEEIKLLSVDKLRLDFFELEDKMWNSTYTFNSKGYIFTAKEEIWLLSRFKLFEQKIRDIGPIFHYKKSPLKQLNLYLQFNEVEKMYQEFRVFLKYCANYQDTLEEISIPVACNIQELISKITDKEEGVISIIENMQKILYCGEFNMLKNLDALTDSKKFWTKNIPQSAQQLYYNLFSDVSITQLKAYILLQYFNLRSLSVSGNSKEVLQRGASTRQSYTSWARDAIEHVSLSDRELTIQRCDPVAFAHGHNYDNFTRLLQGHIENEVDMSKEKTCKESCDQYSLTESYHKCYASDSNYCKTIWKKGRCTGTIRNCFFVDSQASVCFSNYSQNRDYDYISFRNGTMYGTKSYCSNQVNVESWTRGTVRCHYCVCLCDGVTKSDRYISLKMATADIKHNRVVTGVRFVKHKQILQIQIQEGQLGRYGSINQSTVSWVKLDNLGVYEGGKLDGKDFHKMTYDKRSMTLDDLQVLNINYIITGVGFKLTEGVIQLQLRTSPFNWKTGEINQKVVNPIFKSVTDRFKIKINAPDIPTRTQFPSQPHDSKYKIIEFTHTDFVKDAAQTTIPFIDTQEVVTSPAVPLSGIGIYYKGNEGYGGFVAPRVMTYDYGKLVMKDTTEKSVVESLLETLNKLYS